MTDGSKIINGERVVLPQQRITFHAKPEAILEVISGAHITAMVEARIPCKALSLKVSTRERLQKPCGVTLQKHAAAQSLPVMDLSADKTLPEDRGDALPKFERV